MSLFSLRKFQCNKCCPIEGGGGSAPFMCVLVEWINCTCGRQVPGIMWPHRMWRLIAINYRVVSCPPPPLLWPTGNVLPWFHLCLTYLKDVSRVVVEYYYCCTIRDTESRVWWRWRRTLTTFHQRPTHTPGQSEPSDQRTDCVRMEFVIMRHAEGRQWTIDVDDHWPGGWAGVFAETVADDSPDRGSDK